MGSTGDARRHSSEELRESDGDGVALSVGSVIVRELKIAARGLRFIMRKTDGANARSRVEAVLAGDET
jgi:hypothetical protein